MKKIILLFILTISSLIGINATQQQVNGLSVTISHTNPRIYYKNDDIFVDINIKNITTNQIITLISQDRKYSFDLNLITLNNQRIGYRPEYIISFHRVQPIFNTELRLGPNEGYTVTVKLNDFYDLNTTGQFYLSAIYYPFLKRDVQGTPTEGIRSTEIPLNIRPRGFQEDFVVTNTTVTQETTDLLAERRSPPDVVQFTLDARINNEWNKFFLYLDIEELIKSNYIFRDRYIRSDSEVKQELIREYKNYLQQSTVDDISFLPHHYKIARAEYSPLEGRGQVDVIVYFKHLDFTQQVFYTYFLHKKGERWLIYNYESMNMVPR